MPQMAPISWISLFILFSFSFFLFNVINYFCFTKNKKKLMKNENFTNKMTLMIWKW